ncbi:MULTISPECIES: DUF4244 domain-containing protein [Micrococcaceae]|uniref:DUF4244 domain-containing protein n=1 Tax=unclassified Kocuria TaxID=2649579 RepID=UPI001013ACE8|nr:MULTISPECIES: DUF4244 domain-containing protein [unclassified Kocuria]
MHDQLTDQTGFIEENAPGNPERALAKTVLAPAGEPDDPDLGATTAEYGIVMLAAVGFAGLLVVILKSGEVKELLLGVIRTALSTG